MSFCGECGAQLSDDYLFCLNCGAKVVKNNAPVACKQCGKPIIGNNRFCGNCGWKVDAGEEPAPVKAVDAKQPPVQEAPAHTLKPQADSSKPIRPIVCELCGGNNLVKENGFFNCQNCGTKYTLEEARKMMIEGTVQVTGTVKVDNSEKIKNYLMMANSAYGVENYREAEDYANRVIEIDPRNSQAWFVKGKAAAWQSTVGKLRLNESVQYWANAVRFADKSKADDYRKQVTDQIVELNNTIIDVKIGLFLKDPDYANTKGLLEIKDLVEINKSLETKAQLHLNVKELQGAIAARMGNAAVQAYDFANAYYGTRAQQMSSDKYDYWIAYVDNCTDVLAMAMDLTMNVLTLNTLFDNIANMQNKVIGSKSYMFNGKGYVVDKSLTRASRVKRKNLIEEMRIKKNENLQRIGNGG